ncbi:FAD-dependent oxidoreductase [Legionella jordanis]|uniref:Protoporphyrinogen oxidase n=1 Tax=Legionella jordanis TaxID=456 RepID=A0A0W0VCS9_9GAMM|nr:FAD-dependent oxidoreductase [Legionella jordanis]KTD17417.1 protoporphyrinogen oxidase [Legionella jordanis]RMX01818.1 protoporphyrinogen oxidase [Legionella jordanis]RMX15482.1 protoporphyrinogen oxidase [Legionella jordanis]VEH11562.1 protoporphyrinogen oxidase [Legionella jordanis]HAT8714636.1 NAD(P)-binding protein [Legionella jordanis]
MPLNIHKKSFDETTTVAIIGAGPSGAFTAKALQKIGIPAKNITLLEKKGVAGGKCHTWQHPENQDVTAEEGAALITYNYGVVLDLIQEKKIALEEVIPTQHSSVHFIKQYEEKRGFDKMAFAGEFCLELMKYDMALRQYLHTRDNHLALPEEFKLPFAEFAKRKGLNKLNDLLRPLVTGFGYGAMDVFPTYSVFEYIGKTTHLTMAAPYGPFFGIKGGFQRLIEAIVADYNLITSATITSIVRNKNSNHHAVHIKYDHHGTACELKADYLILALPPVHWHELGLDSTPVELACMQNVKFYKYLVAVGQLENYPAQHTFFEEALHQDGFGKLALITTRDARSNPKEGRIVTAYYNQPQCSLRSNPEPITPDIAKMEDELKLATGATKAKILETHLWDDYCSSLSWELMCELDSHQFTNATGYVGPYNLGSFEDVCCVAEHATKLIASYFAPEPAKVYHHSLMADLKRAWGLFKTPKTQPMGSPSKEETLNPNDETSCLL